MTELSKTYSPKEVEEKWLKAWLDQKLFQSTPDPNKDSFSIALPPPNVTGNLHMGHAFGNTIQDVLIRYNKMQGKSVLWQGGTDHAGIGTEVVVEKDLSKKEKKRKRDLGKDEFLKRIWQWKDKHGDEIIKQIKTLGCYMDYDRLAFTMDDNYAKAVKKVFVYYYNKGLIYRGKRIVNWCPKCRTSLSDLEIDSEETKGKLYHILYPFDLNDLGRGGITVATTRPETLFGDVSVCVHPDDGRYKKLVGKHVYLPLINKQIPIISDDAIKMEFGSGAVKTTPAHDANDYDIFERNKEEIKKYGTHFFPYPQCIGANGKVIDDDKVGIPSDIVGQDRFDARKVTLEKLEELGVLQNTTEYDQTKDKHDRCGTEIEPYLSDQWYVRMDDPKHSLARAAIKVVEEGKIKFIPERYTDHYLNWLKNIKDWCISRQLWWGHQIPVWYKKTTDNGQQTRDNKDSIYVGEEPPKDIENYEQDPDVLDTWFSSALWPFVTLGWTGQTTDDGQQTTDLYLKAFYPTTTLATAREIINLWVSRMIFSSLEFLGKIPFENVIIHPVIQTPDGKRMSKSKGNVIDPLEMIDKYGADANRFWYFSVGVTGNQDVRFPGQKGKDGTWSSDTLEQYKRFANKLWNATRFVLQNLEGKKTYTGDLNDIDKSKLTIADQWILYQYTTYIDFLPFSYANYNFSDIAKFTYRFIWDDFCDWYIEIAKKQLLDPGLKDQTQTILVSIFKGITLALHPVMPFITEEIWEALPISEKKKFAILESYPHSNRDFIENPKIAKGFNHVIDTTREIRNLRQTIGIPWTKEIEVRLFSNERFEVDALEHSKSYIESLTKAKVSILNKFEPVKPSTGALISNTRFLIPLSGLVDLTNMIDSLNRKKSKFEKDKEGQLARLNNKSFVDNAPKEKVDEVKTKISEIDAQIGVIDEQLGLLK